MKHIHNIDTFLYWWINSYCFYVYILRISFKGRNWVIAQHLLGLAMHLMDLGLSNPTSFRLSQTLSPIMNEFGNLPDPTLLDSTNCWAKLEMSLATYYTQLSRVQPNIELNHIFFFLIKSKIPFDWVKWILSNQVKDIFSLTKKK